MKSRKVKTHRFNGVKYHIILRDLHGFTDYGPTKDEYSLVVSTKPRSRTELVILIHEAMHAGNWDKHEETIDRSSKEIGNLLWRLGYRRKGK